MDENREIREELSIQKCCSICASQHPFDTNVTSSILQMRDKRTCAWTFHEWLDWTLNSHMHPAFVGFLRGLRTGTAQSSGPFIFPLQPDPEQCTLHKFHIHPMLIWLARVTFPWEIKMENQNQIQQNANHTYWPSTISNSSDEKGKEEGMIEGRKEEGREGGRRWRKEENTPECRNGDETETQMATAMFFHPLQDFFFFFPTRVSATNLSQLLSPEGGTGAFSWDLQLEVSEKTCLATMAFLRKEEERTLLSALTRGWRPEQGVPPNTGCPFTKEHHRLLHLQPWPALPSKPKGRQESGRQRSLLGKLKQRWPPPIISPVLPPNIIMLGRGQAASELWRSRSELKITT